MLDSLLQALAIGLAQGATYALIALGYTMVYGVLGMINFAHGEVFMLGAYAGILAMAGGAASGLTAVHPLAVFCASAAVAVAVCTAHGLAIERVAYRPLRRAHLLAPLISAIGVSIFLQNYLQLTQGSDNKTFPHPVRTAFEERVGAGGLISPIQVMILGIAVLCMLGLHLFVTRTRAGTAIRAVSQDTVMASLVGIHVDRTIAGTFALGSALAAVAGVLVALNYGNAQPYMGYVAGMKAFTAAVLGGIGSIPGAMLGGILLGVVEAAGGRYLPAPEYKDALAFLILLGVLLLRPSGLMGEKSVVKV
jgi:branched-chain amino acid transport system permease protein